MARVRSDNVFGTITNNPLTNVGTTLNAAGLANLAVVTAPDEAIIILDPNRLTGAPEIVVVTAHTGSANSATIQRGQFGTAAREHAMGTEWVHGPIASNATSLVAAADDQGDYPPLGAWQSYAPLTTNLTLGNGSIIAAFTRIGRTIHFRIRFLLGSTSAMGTAPTFTLPVAQATAYDAGGQGDTVGSSKARDTGTADHPGGCVFTASGIIKPAAHNAAGTFLSQADVTATVPFTWANTDALFLSGTYEAVS